MGKTHANMRHLLLLCCLGALYLASALPTTTTTSPCGSTTPSPADKALAATRSHTGRVAGSSALEIADAINAHLGRTASLAPCSDFSHQALNQLLRDLWCSAAPQLNQIFKESSDPRALSEVSLEALEKVWEREREILKDDPSVAAALRDAKCAEVLRVWSHHVPRETQDTLKHLLRLPQMPVYNQTSASHPAVGKAYQESFNCVSGHNLTSTLGVSDHKLPHWPEEVHYTATGHGAYPFWLGGGGSGGTAHLEGWWSEIQAAEKFYHGTCSMSEAGYGSDVPCYHLMLGTQPSPTSYLYTHNEDFCCISSAAASGHGTVQKLTPIASNFMDKMTLNVNYGNVSGTYYTGPVKQWLMTEPWSQPVTYFWYLTDMDDFPVQQGEGGFGGAGIMIYHEYNRSSWGKPAQPFSPDTFAVPEICKTTTKTCPIP